MTEAADSMYNNQPFPASGLRLTTSACCVTYTVVSECHICLCSILPALTPTLIPELLTVYFHGGFPSAMEEANGIVSKHYLKNVPTSLSGLSGLSCIWTRVSFSHTLLTGSSYYRNSVGSSLVIK